MSLYFSRTGADSSWNVLIRFRIVSSLSSSRPLVSPRFTSLLSIVSSDASKYSRWVHLQTLRKWRSRRQSRRKRLGMCDVTESLEIHGRCEEIHSYQQHKFSDIITVHACNNKCRNDCLTWSAFGKIYVYGCPMWLRKIGESVGCLLRVTDGIHLQAWARRSRKTKKFSHEDFKVFRGGRRVGVGYVGMIYI